MNFQNKIYFTSDDLKVIHALFDSLQAIFPAFRNAWPNQELFDSAKVEWMKAFRESNIFDCDEIEIGLSKFRLLPSPFVPSPGKFIEMCRPKSYRIPFYQSKIAESSSKQTAMSHLKKLKEILKCPSRQHLCQQD